MTYLEFTEGLSRLKQDWLWMTDDKGRPLLTRMHDPNWSLGFHYDDYPAVRRGYDKLALVGDAAFKMPAEHVAFDRTLNTPRAQYELERVAGGIYNKRSKQIPENLADYEGDAVHEPVFAAGNLAIVEEWRGKAVRLATYTVGERAPDPGEVNYDRAPWAVTKFTSVTKSGKQGKAFGLDAYYLNLSKSGSLWIESNSVEKFPNLPMWVQGRSWPWLNLREGPGTDFGREISFVNYGQWIQVLSYVCRGSWVWGKTLAGWIALQHVDQFFTSWRMETATPK